MNDPAAPGPRLLRWWRRVARIPGGRWLFSRCIDWMVPYTGSIGACVEELSPGFARVTLRDRRRVRNHLRSVHAVAITNLGEVTSGLAMLTGVPPGVRAIVRRITVDFEKKARGRLSATCRTDPPDVTTDIEHDVQAEVRDDTGDLVARVRVRWRLSPS